MLYLRSHRYVILSTTSHVWLYQMFFERSLKIAFTNSSLGKLFFYFSFIVIRKIFISWDFSKPVMKVESFFPYICRYVYQLTFQKPSVYVAIGSRDDSFRYSGGPYWKQENFLLRSFQFIWKQTFTNCVIYLIC